MAFWEEIGADPALREILLHGATDDLSRYQGNIENFIGLLRMPLGSRRSAAGERTGGQGRLSGSRWPPPRPRLVASYHRGCRVAHRGRRMLGDGALRKPEPRAGVSFSKRRATPAASSSGRWRGSRSSRRIAATTHLARQTRRCRLHGGGQPRLSEFRVHHRRRLRPEHGHARDPGDLR